jgi:dTDP-4-amino-4,6-dideoxygalactose transaminase
MSNSPSGADPVPLASPRDENALLRTEIAAAMMRVVDGGDYILGPEVAGFEAALASQLAVKDVIGVASGTDALVLAMLALGVGAGDEVITVSHTAGPTVAAIRMIGAIPVLVDVEEASYCLDPRLLRQAVSPLTKAIIAVHLYGHPADMAAIAAIGIPVIEDCAQAQGALLGNKPVGGFGAASCFSFYPTKNLGAIGDGGAVASNDEAVASRVRRLRAYGWSKPQFAELEGGRCSRLDELQAAILAVKLKGLQAAIARRRAVAARYREAFSDLPLKLPDEAAGVSHAYHLFVVRSERRDALQSHLSARSVASGRHYPLPVHHQPGLAAQARLPAPLPVTERISGEILSLPIFATITDAQVDRVIEAVRSFHA